MATKKPKMDLVQQAIEGVNNKEIALTLWYFGAPGMEKQIGVRGRISSDDEVVSGYHMREKEGALYWIEKITEDKVEIHCIADVLGIHDLRRKKAYYVDVPEMTQEIHSPEIKHSYETGRGQCGIIRAILQTKDGQQIKDMSVDLVARVLKEEQILPMGVLPGMNYS